MQTLKSLIPTLIVAIVCFICGALAFGACNHGPSSAASVSSSSLPMTPRPDTLRLTDSTSTIDSIDRATKIVTHFVDRWHTIVVKLTVIDTVRDTVFANATAGDVQASLTHPTSFVDSGGAVRPGENHSLAIQQPDLTLPPFTLSNKQSHLVDFGGGIAHDFFGGGYLAELTGRMNFGDVCVYAAAVLFHGFAALVGVDVYPWHLF